MATPTAVTFLILTLCYVSHSFDSVLTSQNQKRMSKDQLRRILQEHQQNAGHYYDDYEQGRINEVPRSAKFGFHPQTMQFLHNKAKRVETSVPWKVNSHEAGGSANNIASMESRPVEQDGGQMLNPMRSMKMKDDLEEMMEDNPQLVMDALEEEMEEEAQKEFASNRKHHAANVQSSGRAVRPDGPVMKQGESVPFKLIHKQN